MRIPGDCHKSSCAVSSEGLWGVWDQFCKFCPYLGSTVGNAVCVGFVVLMVLLARLVGRLSLKGLLLQLHTGSTN